MAPLERLTLSRPYSESELLSDHIAIQMAANSLMDNTCTEDDFNRLATAFNTTALVACEGNAHLHRITQPVLQALISVKKRYEKWGKWDLTQHEKEQLQNGVDITHELMRHSTPLQVDRAARRLAAIRKTAQ